MRRALPLIALLLASCGEPATLGNVSAEGEGKSAEEMVTTARAVRVGELGPNFRACTGAGTTRNLRSGEALPVRSAPFDYAAGSGSVPAGARFFVCSRSLDQKWFGIVFDESGRLEDRCGVSEPLTRRQDYAGPCRSGWVQSAFVKLVSGIEQPLPPSQPESSATTAAGI